MGIRQIEHLEDGVVGGLILAFHDGVLDTHLLDSHIVLKHSLAVQPNPGKGGAGHGQLHVGIGLHILVDILLIVGAEPQLAVLLPGEHKGAALGLSIPAHGSQVLDRVLGQEFYDFVHNRLPPKCCCVDWFSWGCFPLMIALYQQFQSL